MVMFEKSMPTCKAKVHWSYIACKKMFLRHVNSSRYNEMEPKAMAASDWSGIACMILSIQVDAMSRIAKS